MTIRIHRTATLAAIALVALSAPSRGDTPSATDHPVWPAQSVAPSPEREDRDDRGAEGLEDDMDAVGKELSAMERALLNALRSGIDAFSKDLGPAMDSLNRAIDKMPQYETPEILPNGDILIRRKRKDGPDAAPRNERRRDDKSDAPVDL